MPAVVRGDPGRVRQVLTNLIGNAIKFTQAGEIIVRVHEVAAAGDATTIRFEVSDTGDGIAADKLALVFQPFVQADTSTSRKYGGTGLGLAISSQLVSLMGGDCGVSSELGSGSAFWFTIPVHADADAPAHALAPGPTVDLAGLRVLVVDDNATQRSVLTETLTAWGMVAIGAESGEAALTAMRAAAGEDRAFPVALVDRAMPGMDGLVLKDAMAEDAALTTRVVLMTSFGEDRDVRPAAESGVAASLAQADPHSPTSWPRCASPSGCRSPRRVPSTRRPATRRRRSSNGSAGCCWPRTTGSTRRSRSRCSRASDTRWTRWSTEPRRSRQPRPGTTTPSSWTARCRR